MIRGQTTGSGFGAVQVATSSDGGHSVEFWVGDIMAQIVHVSAHAPPPIRDQALAYADQVRAVVDNGVRNAIASDRTTLVHHLNKAGMHEAAALIQTIRR